MSFALVVGWCSECLRLLGFDLQRIQSAFSNFISSWLFVSVESRFNPAEIIRAGRPIVQLSPSVNFSLGMSAGTH